jgi:hypothetical protein
MNWLCRGAACCALRNILSLSSVRLYFFALFPNFDRLEPKSKTYGIIGSALWASFGKNRTYCPDCFTITDDLAKK